MRNPLNSIINQCKLLYTFITQQFNLISKNKQALGQQATIELEDLHGEIMNSVSVMNSSSNMLLLHVEDILGYAQLKAGKFIKDIKSFNVRRTIDEIISIQQYKAEAKNIIISTSFLGFPLLDKTLIKKVNDVPSPEKLNLILSSDEKRIKQVLMNLLSNSLKFTRDCGKIKIIA